MTFELWKKSSQNANSSSISTMCIRSRDGGCLANLFQVNKLYIHFAWHIDHSAMKYCERLTQSSHFANFYFHLNQSPPDDGTIKQNGRLTNRRDGLS
jgi:hypothetical protein